jgi:hypothetical protein
MSPSDLYLLTVIAEPKARRAVAKAYNLPSGVLPVLAAIGFRGNQNESTCPDEIYGAKLGAETLIRYYLNILVKAQLVERYRTGQVRRLRLTPVGAAAVRQYEREMRDGAVAFGRVRPQRVLTRPLLLS